MGGPEVVDAELTAKVKTVSDVGRQTIGAASAQRRTTYVRGVDKQITSRKPATAKRAVLPEVGSLMSARVVEDQAGEGAVTPNMASVMTQGVACIIA